VIKERRQAGMKRGGSLEVAVIWPKLDWTRKICNTWQLDHQGLTVGC
jgi:hypothetical protein